MKSTFKTISSLLLFFASAAFATSPPTLFYSDLVSGPKSGGESGGGAYVTVCGNNLGSTITATIGGGTSTIKTQPYTYQWYQCAVLQLNAASTTGNIVVTAGGQTSNGLAFTVRTGSIFAVSTTGSDSAAGSFAAPWLTIPHATANSSAGDTIYVENGVTVTTVDPNAQDSQSACVQMNNTNSGSSGSPKAVGVYPGATVTLGQDKVGPGCAPGVQTFGNASPTTDVVVFGFNIHGGDAEGLTMQGGLQHGETRIRYINNTVDCTWSNAEQGCASLFNTDSAIWYGNIIHNVSTNVTVGTVTALQQGFYQGDSSFALDFGWNTIANVNGCRAYQENTSDNTNATATLIHDNVIHDSICDGIVMTALSPSSTSAIYNNVIYNVGTGPIPPGGSGAFDGINIQTFNDTGSGIMPVYNNTIYNNSFSGNLDPSFGGGFVFWQASGSSGIIFTNNIVYPVVSSTPYLTVLCSGSGTVCTGTATFVTGSTNLFFGQGAAPTYGALSAPTVSNPLFVSTSTPDFHLQSGSPAKNGGTTESSVPYDHDGLSRPQNATYSSGAFEIAGSSAASIPASLTGSKSRASSKAVSH